MLKLTFLCYEFTGSMMCCSTQLHTQPHHNFVVFVFILVSWSKGSKERKKAERKIKKKGKKNPTGNRRKKPLNKEQIIIIQSECYICLCYVKLVELNGFEYDGVVISRIFSACVCVRFSFYCL